MPSPETGHFVVLSLIAIGAFFALAAAILGWSASRFRLAIRDDSYDLADDPPHGPGRVTEQEPASEARLQFGDGFVGASRGVHTPDSDATSTASLRGSHANGERTL